MIDLKELIAELQHLDQQRTLVAQNRDDAIATLGEIDGATKMVRHLLTKAQANVEKRHDQAAAEDAARNNGTDATGTV